MSVLHITSRPGGERRELQVAPGVPAQPGSHLPALLGDGAWAQRVGRDEWPLKLALKSRRRKSRTNPCICSWSVKWEQLPLLQESCPGSVCSLPGLHGQITHFQSHNQMQSRAGSQPSAAGRSSQKGGKNKVKKYHAHKVIYVVPNL